MIDLKNRSRETLTLQYPRDVSAGPVRPQVITAPRSSFNAKTGERVRKDEQLTIGGVLTIPPRATVTRLPEVLLDHPVLKREIAARRVIVKPSPERKRAAKPAPKRAAAKPPAPPKKARKPELDLGDKE